MLIPYWIKKAIVSFSSDSLSKTSMNNATTIPVAQRKAETIIPGFFIRLMQRRNGMMQRIDGAINSNPEATTEGNDTRRLSKGPIKRDRENNKAIRNKIDIQKENKNGDVLILPSSSCIRLSINSDRFDLRFILFLLIKRG